MLTFFLVAYIILTILVGFWASRRVKNSKDFILAGKNLPAVMVGVTIFSTWFGSEMIMGVPADFVKEGIQGLIVDAGGSLLCLTLISLFFVRPIYRLNILTINDFYKLRYNKSIEIFTSIILIFSYFSWVGSQLLALAYIFHSLYGWAIWSGVVLSASIVVLYTYVGGMWAVSVTDLIQAIIMFLGLSYILLVLHNESDGIFNILSKQKESFFDFFPKSGFGNWMDYIHKWMIFGIGAIVSQEIYQRVLSAKSQSHAKSGVFVGGILMFTIGIIPSLIGIIVYQLHPELMELNDGQNLITSMVTQYLGIPIQIVFFGALISAILSTSSGAVLAPAAVLAENLIKSDKTNFTDEHLLKATRYSVLIIAFISCIYTFFSSSIHNLVVNSVTLIMTSMTVPFVLGIYWKKSSIFGAWLSIIAGIAFWLLALEMETNVDPTFYGLGFSFVFMIAGSFLKPDKSYINFLHQTLKENENP